MVISTEATQTPSSVWSCRICRSAVSRTDAGPCVRWSLKDVSARPKSNGSHDGGTLEGTPHCGNSRGGDCVLRRDSSASVVVRQLGIVRPEASEVTFAGLGGAWWSWRFFFGSATYPLVRVEIGSWGLRISPSSWIAKWYVPIAEISWDKVDSIRVWGNGVVLGVTDRHPGFIRVWTHDGSLLAEVQNLGLSVLPRRGSRVTNQ